MTRPLVALGGSVMLVGRRAVSQAGLLAAVLVAVLVGTATLGLCVLLLTTAQQQSLRTSLSAADPAQVELRAAFTLLDGDPGGVQRDTARVLTELLAPFPATVSTWATTTMRELPGVAGSDQDEGIAGTMGYLAGISDPRDRVRLVSGTWPEPAQEGGAWDVIVPVGTAEALALAPGDRITLGPEVTGRTNRTPEIMTDTEITLRVVGTFTPRHGVGWERDPLSGSGHDRAYQDISTWGGRTWDAYGPFVTDASRLIGDDTATTTASDAGAPSDQVGVDRLTVTARPGLTEGDRTSLDAVLAAVSTAGRQVDAVLGDRVESVSVGSALPTTVSEARRQQSVTGSGILVVALVGSALAATALQLAGRLLATHRTDETALLLARGASRRRIALDAAVESVALAAVASALAIPLSLALYRALSTSEPLAAAGWGSAPVSAALVGTVAGGALALAGLLVLSAWRTGRNRARSRHRLGGDLARSGLDLLLVGLAVVAVLQLRDHRLTAAGGPDPVLVAAPVLCLVAGSTVALRTLPLLLGWADTRARRSRRIGFPLATWDLARRRQATGSTLLLVLAAATGTFALSALATWTGSQTDQADVTVGTELAVDPPPAPPLLQAALLGAAIGGDVQPVTDRPVLLGSGLATSSTPQLVALDTRRGGELMRGALPAGPDGSTPTWAGLTAGLAPTTPVAGLPVAQDDTGWQVMVTGTGEAGGVPVLVTPTLVLQDGSGNRVPYPGTRFLLDGAEHRVELRLEGTPEPPLRVVAVRLEVTGGADAEFTPIDLTSAARTPVTLTIDGASAATDGDSGADSGTDAWQAAEIQAFTPTRPIPVATHPDAGPVHSVVVDTSLATSGLAMASVTLMVTAFEAPTDLPVLATTSLAAASGVQPGDAVDLGVEYQTLPATVQELIPYVPSVPRGPALLVDRDLLSRSLLARGEMNPLVDRWWSGDVADPLAAAERVGELELGTALTRTGVADELSSGPMRVGIPTGMGVLAAAAAVLALIGIALHTAAVSRQRALETARLQGLGVPRRTLVASLLLQHAIVSVLALVLGTAVGAITSQAVSPWLTVSARGARPVPTPSVVWPWGPQLLFLATLLVGGGLLVAVLASRAVSRATAAHLRLDGPT